MIFLFIFLLMGVCFYLGGVHAKKNPSSQIKNSYNLSRMVLSPEVVKLYANKMAKMQQLMGVFYVVFAFVQYLVGSPELTLTALFVSIMFISIYQFYCQKTLIGKASTGLLIFVTLVMVGVFGSIAYSYIEASVIVEDEGIRISGKYGVKIPLNQINEVFLADTLPRIGIRTFGISTGTIRKGNFQSKSLKRNIKLLLHSKTKPYVYIIYADNKYLIVNFRKKEKTQQVYELLKVLTRNGQNASR